MPSLLNLNACFKCFSNWVMNFTNICKIPHTYTGKCKLRNNLRSVGVHMVIGLMSSHTRIHSDQRPECFRFCTRLPAPAPPPPRPLPGRVHPERSCTSPLPVVMGFAWFWVSRKWNRTICLPSCLTFSLCVCCLNSLFLLTAASHLTFALYILLQPMINYTYIYLINTYNILF